MTGLDRRSFVGVVGATLALPSFASAQMRDAPASWRFFSKDEAAFVTGCVARLIPDEPDWPGAVGCEVARYIDLQLAGPFGQGERFFKGGPHKPGTPSQGYQLPWIPAELYRRALAVLLERTDGGEAFLSAPTEKQDRFLNALEHGDADLDGVPSAVFFETLLANTIEGYFADPVYGGNRDMAAWRMVGFPGAHAAFLGIYTQHGIRYDGTPVSIAGAAATRHHQP